LADWPSVVMWLCLEFGWVISNWREKVSEWIERGRDPAVFPHYKGAKSSSQTPSSGQSGGPISKHEVWKEQKYCRWSRRGQIPRRTVLSRTGCNLLDWRVVSQFWPWWFARESPAGRDMRKEAAKSTMCGAVTRHRLLNTWKICVLQYNELSNV
jgi:hypothetical protein